MSSDAQPDQLTWLGPVLRLTAMLALPGCGDARLAELEELLSHDQWYPVDDREALWSELEQLLKARPDLRTHLHIPDGDEPDPRVDDEPEWFARARKRFTEGDWEDLGEAEDGANPNPAEDFNRRAYAKLAVIEACDPVYADVVREGEPDWVARARDTLMRRDWELLGGAAIFNYCRGNPRTHAAENMAHNARVKAMLDWRTAHPVAVVPEDRPRGDPGGYLLEERGTYYRVPVRCTFAPDASGRSKRSVPPYVVGLHEVVPIKIADTLLVERYLDVAMYDRYDGPAALRPENIAVVHARAEESAGDRVYWMVCFDLDDGASSDARILRALPRGVARDMFDGLCRSFCLHTRHGEGFDWGTSWPAVYRLLADDGRPTTECIWNVQGYGAPRAEGLVPLDAHASPVRTRLKGEDVAPTLAHMRWMYDPGGYDLPRPLPMGLIASAMVGDDVLPFLLLYARGATERKGQSTVSVRDVRRVYRRYVDDPVRLSAYHIGMAMWNCVPYLRRLGYSGIADTRPPRGCPDRTLTLYGPGKAPPLSACIRRAIAEARGWDAREHRGVKRWIVFYGRS
ncbi:MAG: hypothetical protein ACKVI4_17365, partial [Actinomycetales bacterium]